MDPALLVVPTTRSAGSGGAGLGGHLFRAARFVPQNNLLGATLMANMPSKGAGKPAPKPAGGKPAAKPTKK